MIEYQRTTRGKANKGIGSFSMVSAPPQYFVMGDNYTARNPYWPYRQSLMQFYNEVITGFVCING